MNAGKELRSLRDRPFELLKELDRRSRASQHGQEGAGSGSGEWVGVAIRSAGQQWLVPRDEVREIMEFPPTTRVPGARDWVRGITNVRGRLVPVVDLLAFNSEGPTDVGRASRLIVVNHAEIPAAILVDEVMGFRRFAANEFLAAAETADDGGFVLGRCRRGKEEWPVLSLAGLVESSRFSDVAA
ncbi:MAG: chemotaxis protein CheW [Gammaproteobacteria bacterium]|nr:chemotaxis protein CheW [Gammaproteobacteria bacterium]